MNKKLYEDLLALRNHLKFKYMENGRVPVVCTDEALLELSQKAPKHKNQLECISGLGKVFVEKYGDEFMAIIEQHHKREGNSKTLTHDVRMTLKNLENRLVNINKRNRLLYQAKLTDKTGIDLFSTEAKNSRLLDTILGNSSRAINICDINDGKDSSLSFYKKLVTLSREVNRQYRESGQLDLYIGYPYVIGKLHGHEGFEIRAPLALFPAELHRSADKFSLKVDQNRDVLFNNNLILSLLKVSNLNRPLPNNIAEKENRTAFLEEINSFYTECGLKLDIQFNDLEKFVQYTAEEFPKFKPGQFRVESNAVLGKFSLYSSAMQRDFSTILEKTEINDNLFNLLDTNGGEASDLSVEVTEEKLFNITDLNYSQEKAMLALENCKSLVIQGPPGTGKSQVIASIISDFALKGRSVLLVSQKKAAIDVIYSRLANLNRFAIILDDAKNKEFFYKQVSNLLQIKQENATEITFAPINKNIQNEVDTLERVNTLLFKPNENGNVFGEIYNQNATNPFFNGNFEHIKDVQAVVSDGLKCLPYKEIKNLESRFQDKQMGYFAVEYFSVLEKYPFLLHLKSDLGRLEQFAFCDAVEKYLAAKKENATLKFWARLKGSFKIKRELKKIFKQYFVSKKFLKYTYKNDEALSNSLQFVEKFSEVRLSLEPLGNTALTWAKTVFLLHKNSLTTEKANQLIFDFLVLSLTDSFEKKNQWLINYISNYNDIVASTSEKLVDKKALVIKFLADKLRKDCQQNILSAKRAGELKRATESKRKMSIGKFIDKFSFEIFSGIKIWLMTVDTVSEILPCEELFDLVIFDEASQIYIEKTVPSFARAKKAVVAGDHKQLRPSSLGVGRVEYDDETEDEEFEVTNAALEEESLLDLVRFKFSEVMLNYHYRSRYSQLINFSNSVFYDGKLFVAPNSDTPEKPPIEVLKVENGVWNKRTNVAEAKKVVEILKDVFLNRKNNQSIGILTFNSNQRDLIADMLDLEAEKDEWFASVYQKEQMRTENGEDKGLFVKNIENVQGDERDIMIFSVAYAKTASGRVVRNYGWLNQSGGENRLNVAVTRAKEKIFVVTSLNPEQLVTDDLTHNGPRIFKKYLEYANAVSQGNTENINAILNFFENKESSEAKCTEIRDLLVNALNAFGIKTESDVGVGDYRLDFAVKNDDGEYVLGVEIDSSVYGKGNSRERDVHRYRYLATRKWKIHRVFSLHFNIQREVEKILCKLKMNKKPEVFVEGNS